MATSSLYLLRLKILESYLTLAHLPHPICHEILLAISLKHIRIQLLLTTSVAITLIKLWFCNLDYCTNLLTGLPLLLLWILPKSIFNTAAIPIMSLLCSKPCNGFLSHSEKKPNSFPVSTMPSHLVPDLSLPNFLLLPLSHPMPHTSLIFYENTRHSHTLRLQNDCSPCLEYFN